MVEQRKEIEADPNLGAPGFCRFGVFSVFSTLGRARIEFDPGLVRLSAMTNNRPTHSLELANSARPCFVIDARAQDLTPAVYAARASSVYSAGKMRRQKHKTPQLEGKSIEICQHVSQKTIHSLQPHRRAKRVVGFLKHAYFAVLTGIPGKWQLFSKSLGSRTIPFT